jgi:hypothetical protein
MKVVGVFVRFFVRRFIDEFDPSTGLHGSSCVPLMLTALRIDQHLDAVVFKPTRLPEQSRPHTPVCKPVGTTVVHTQSDTTPLPRLVI